MLEAQRRQGPPLEEGNRSHSRRHGLETPGAEDQGLHQLVRLLGPRRAELGAQGEEGNSQAKGTFRKGAMPEPSGMRLREGAQGGASGVGLACAEAMPLLKAEVRALLGGGQCREAHPLRMEETCSWGTCFSPTPPPEFDLNLGSQP